MCVEIYRDIIEQMDLKSIHEHDIHPLEGREIINHCAEIMQEREQKVIVTESKLGSV